MNDYKELLRYIGVCLLAHPSETVSKIMLERAADAIEQLVKERDTLRNELCLRCGEYVEAHNGACNGCKWRTTDDN